MQFEVDSLICGEKISREKRNKGVAGKEGENSHDSILMWTRPNISAQDAWLQPGKNERDLNKNIGRDKSDLALLHKKILNLVGGVCYRGI